MFWANLMGEYVGTTWEIFRFSLAASLPEESYQSVKMH